MEQLPYRRFLVWEKANALALDVLVLADEEPLKRRFWMRNQVCDAAMSIPVNIAEGAGRGTNLDFANFLDRARGSLFELDVWLNALSSRGELAASRHEQFQLRILELNAMLVSLRLKLRTDGALSNRREV